MERRVLVRNPVSGNQKRSVQAAGMARDRGFEIRNTEEEGDDIRLAREAAADGADVIVACGGDGTLNGVVRGVDRAGRLGEVTLGVVPAGTGNGFADNVGIRDVPQAFDVLEHGETRRLDVGMVDDPRDGDDAVDGGGSTQTDGTDDDPFADGPRPFLNSCVCGLTAEASAETEPELKKRVGVLAYVLTTLQQTREFDGVELDIRAGPEGDPLWSGEAAVLLAGNARRFPGQQAAMEDGNLDVLVVEHAPAIDYLANGAIERLLGGDTPYLTRLTVPSLVVDATEPRQFSLDGEMVERQRVEISTRERAMTFTVGEEYEPNPTFEEDDSDGVLGP